MNTIYFSSTDSYQAHFISQNKKKTKKQKIAHKVFETSTNWDSKFFFAHRIKVNGGKQQTVSQLYEKQLCNNGEGV